MSDMNRMSKSNPSIPNSFLSSSEGKKESKKATNIHGVVHDSLKGRNSNSLSKLDQYSVEPEKKMEGPSEDAIRALRSRNPKNVKGLVSPFLADFLIDDSVAEVSYDFQALCDFSSSLGAHALEKMSPFLSFTSQRVEKKQEYEPLSSPMIELFLERAVEDGVIELKDRDAHLVNMMILLATQDGTYKNLNDLFEDSKVLGAPSNHDWRNGLGSLGEGLDLEETPLNALRNDLDSIPNDWSRDFATNLEIEGTNYQEIASLLFDYYADEKISQEAYLQGISMIMVKSLKNKAVKVKMDDEGLQKVIGLAFFFTTQNIIGNTLAAHVYQRIGVNPLLEIAFFKGETRAQLLSTSKSPSKIVERNGHLFFVKEQVFHRQDENIIEMDRAVEEFPEKFEFSLVVDMEEPEVNAIVINKAENKESANKKKSIFGRSKDSPPESPKMTAKDRLSQLFKGSGSSKRSHTD